MLNKEFYKNASVRSLFVYENIDKDMDVRDFDRWLNSEHAILDDSERRYLRCVILPFYDKVKYIVKCKSLSNGKCFIRIELSYCESVNLPWFCENEMYCGVEAGKAYTLKELGIFK